MGGGWLVAGSGEREREREREEKEREREGERGRDRTVCGAGRRHVISQIDKFQSSAKAKSRGY